MTDETPSPALAAAIHRAVAADVDSTYDATAVTRQIHRRLACRRVPRTLGAVALSAGLVLVAAVVGVVLPGSRHSGSSSPPGSAGTVLTAATVTPEQAAAFADRAPAAYRVDTPDTFADRALLGQLLIAGRDDDAVPVRGGALFSAISVDRDGSRALLSKSGYDASSLAALAHYWHESDITAVQLVAAEKLREHYLLPITPGGSVRANVSGGTGRPTVSPKVTDNPPYLVVPRDTSTP